MRLVLLGVRGSTPAPGASFTRYGGHTSSVAVLGDSSPVPQLVLDAGTGVRDLPGLLGGAALRGAVVLSHLHWDHLHGLPFCPALDHPDARVELWIPAQPPGDHADVSRSAAAGDLEAWHLLADVMSPPHFPIGPGGLLGDWRFRLAAPGQLDLDRDLTGGARVEVAPVRHKGGTTFAVRVDLDGASIAYVPDHTLSAPDGRPQPVDAAAVELVHGVDLLLHDGQFAGAGEAGLAADYGHSTIEDALVWADRCRVGRVVLTHHGPARTDEALDALAAQFRKTPDGREVTFAVQGSTLEI